MTDQELVDALAEVWSSIDVVCAPLSKAEWSTLTECPGWTVQDNVAHIIGIEAMSMGIATPELDPPEAPHIKNDVGRMNEIWVESMRALEGAAVLARFREVTGGRIAALRALDADGFGGESWTPVGPGTVRDLLPFRMFDSWVHEQDIRRALGTPGHLTGPAAEVEHDGGAVGRLHLLADHVGHRADDALDRCLGGGPGEVSRRTERAPDVLLVHPAI
ncbi:MAG TPA: maleylpyruvate isomerase family mycothiol-dependent enzyme, partial [Acidimicrobiia bacterium]|nr:maleylpyruvate isomerase family mycothiol-dependent enzyme [Acidimicrobiia bacterium]